MTNLKKYNNLIDYLKTLDSICIAYSSGVDSTFLLSAAKEALGDNVLAVTVNSSMCPDKEIEEAKKFTKQLDVKHIIIDANEYSINEFVQNNKDRCYYCKKAIFSNIINISSQNKIKNVADGSNVDDDSDYRPGMRAIKELGVLSPLKIVGLTKQEIRDISKELNIYTWNKPSMACLASRVPYGSEITKDKLSKIELAEEYLLSKGFRQFRVRYYDELAKIELNENEILDILKIKDEVIEKFKKIGFTYIAIDLQGYRSGSMNEVLDS